MEALSGFFFELTAVASSASPGWASGFLFKALSFIVVLGLLIFFHELGHFLVAKLCGVKCEKFYLGFDIAGIAAGMAKMPVRTFLLFTWIGQMIKMLIFALAGKYSIFFERNTGREFFQ